MKIACISLGCPKNQVDLDVMVHILLSAGHETVADLGESDVILVNTCGFIESAKTEAIENILEACAYKQQNPELKVIVTGCLAERYRSQIEEEIPEVDAVVGCASNKAIDSIVARLFQGENHLESYGAKKEELHLLLLLLSASARNSGMSHWLEGLYFHTRSVYTVQRLNAAHKRSPDLRLWMEW